MGRITLAPQEQVMVSTGVDFIKCSGHAPDGALDADHGLRRAPAVPGGLTGPQPPPVQRRGQDDGLGRARGWRGELDGTLRLPGRGLRRPRGYGEGLATPTPRRRRRSAPEDAVVDARLVWEG
jgi:hypothetical protein